MSRWYNHTLGGLNKPIKLKELGQSILKLLLMMCFEQAISRCLVRLQAKILDVCNKIIMGSIKLTSIFLKSFYIDKMEEICRLIAKFPVEDL